MDGRVEIEPKNIGLERLETALLHMPAEGDQVIQRAHGCDAQHFGIADAIAAAMRPVERQLLAHRAAEQRIDGHAQSLCLHIQKRILDRRNGLLVDAAGRLARDGV